VEVSRVAVSEDDFGLAEIASGFNKTTRISPLHAALMAAAVANDGVMMVPWLAENIQSATGTLLYQAAPSSITTPIETVTAKTLRILMEETVSSGTCRKAFHSLRKSRALRNISLGAKTGTINNQTDEWKFDWITAYALPEQKEKGICLAVLAVHGEKLGIRSKDLAALIIKHHFSS
jgi:cell division protein FtsI/penicillin-binding protein 2